MLRHNSALIAKFVFRAYSVEYLRMLPKKHKNNSYLANFPFPEKLSILMHDIFRYFSIILTSYIYKFKAFNHTYKKSLKFLVLKSRTLKKKNLFHKRNVKFFLIIKKK